MAVIGNTASEIGDTIVMQMTLTVTGVTQFTSYSEVVSGVTATRFWSKEYRYSLDGGLNWNYEGVIPLTSISLLDIPVSINVALPSPSKAKPFSV